MVVNFRFLQKKNTSSIRQRFQEVIDRKRAERGSHKGWKSLMFWVNEHAYMDQESFLHFGATNWKYRADPSGEFQPESILLLDDLKTNKTKRVREEFKSLYNTEIIILPGGLTPKVQPNRLSSQHPQWFPEKERMLVNILSLPLQRKPTQSQEIENQQLYSI